MKYTYTNSSVLDLNQYRDQYCSDDGNFVVIPMAGKAVKYTTIIKGQPSGKIYRKFDTALKTVLKLQQKYEKSLKN